MSDAVRSFEAADRVGSEEALIEEWSRHEHILSHHPDAARMRSRVAAAESTLAAISEMKAALAAHDDASVVALASRHGRALGRSSQPGPT